MSYRFFGYMNTKIADGEYMVKGIVTKAVPDGVALSPSIGRAVVCMPRRFTKFIDNHEGSVIYPLRLLRAQLKEDIGWLGQDNAQCYFYNCFDRKTYVSFLNDNQIVPIYEAKVEDIGDAP